MSEGGFDRLPLTTRFSHLSDQSRQTGRMQLLLLDRYSISIVHLVVTMPIEVTQTGLTFGSPLGCGVWVCIRGEVNTQ